MALQHEPQRSEAAEILSEYSQKLMLSGGARLTDFISTGLAGFKRQCEKSDKVEVLLYRPRE